MNNLVPYFIAPILVATIILIVEYWIIQPLKNQLTQDEDGPQSKQYIGFKYLFKNLFISIPSSTFNIMTANIVSVSGKIIFYTPIWILTFMRTLLIIIIAIPIFTILYYSEKTNNCCFDPTCRAYLIDALSLHGPIRGFSLAMRRVMRCHPWGGHGYDPVPLNLEGYMYPPNASSNLKKSEIIINFLLLIIIYVLILILVPVLLFLESLSSPQLQRIAERFLEVNVIIKIFMLILVFYFYLKAVSLCINISLKASAYSNHIKIILLFILCALSVSCIIRMTEFDF